MFGDNYVFNTSYTVCLYVSPHAKRYDFNTHVLSPITTLLLLIDVYYFKSIIDSRDYFILNNTHKLGEFKGLVRMEQSNAESKVSSTSAIGESVGPSVVSTSTVEIGGTMMLPRKPIAPEFKYLTVGDLFKQLGEMLTANPEVAYSALTASTDGHNSSIIDFVCLKKFVKSKDSTYHAKSCVSVRPTDFFNVLQLISSTKDGQSIPYVLRDMYNETSCKSIVERIPTLEQFVEELNKLEETQTDDVTIAKKIQQTHYYNTRFYRFATGFEGKHIWIDEESLISKAVGLTREDFKTVCTVVHPQILHCTIPFSEVKRQLFVTPVERLNRLVLVPKLSTVVNDLSIVNAVAFKELLNGMLYMEFPATVNNDVEKVEIQTCACGNTSSYSLVDNRVVICNKCEKAVLYCGGEINPAEAKIIELQLRLQKQQQMNISLRECGKTQLPTPTPIEPSQHVRDIITQPWGEWKLASVTSSTGCIYNVSFKPCECGAKQYQFCSKRNVVYCCKGHQILKIVL
jgi:hypothetical protein